MILQLEYSVTFMNIYRNLLVGHNSETINSYTIHVSH